MRHVFVRYDLDWAKHLKYLDNDAELIEVDGFCHQIQWTLYATRTQWWDFVIWILQGIEGINRYDLWGKNYIKCFEDLYEEKEKQEENDETTDTEEEQKGKESAGRQGSFGDWNRGIGK